MRIQSLFAALVLQLVSFSVLAEVALDRLEATVNSSVILLSDVARFRKTLLLRGQLDPLFAGTDLAKKGAGASDMEIVQFLIQDRLIGQLFPVNESEVEQEIGLIISNNRISRKELEAAITNQGFKFSDYFNLIRISVSKKRLIDRDIRTKVFVSDDDVKNHYYSSFSGSKNLSYRLQMISVRPESYQSLAAAKEAAQKALRALRGGEDFSEVAKRFSDGPTATSGGDLGFLSEEELSPELKQQLSKLKVGAHSEIFGGPKSGYLLIKLADMKSNKDDQLKERLEELRQKLAAKEYQHQIQLWIEREKQKAYVYTATDTH